MRGRNVIISSSFHKFLTNIFGKSGVFKVKMSSLDTYFCFDLILMGIEYYIFTIYFFPHPWSVHDLCKGGKLLSMTYHLTASSDPMPLHATLRPVLTKCQARGRLPHGETKPSIATLTLEEQGDCTEWKGSHFICSSGSKWHY